MLHVATFEQAKNLLELKFGKCHVGKEPIALIDAVDRVLAQAVVAKEDVPGFDRSTVDGFAVHAQILSAVQRACRRFFEISAK